MKLNAFTLLPNGCKSDLKQILDLQYVAYQSEANLLHNFNIPPLKQTLEALEYEFQSGILLKAMNDEGQIVGSIRGHVEGSTLLVGKLFVSPQYQGKGIDSKLLKEIEKGCPQPRYELFTSNKSIRNIEFYERMGYVKFKGKAISADLCMIYLEKCIAADTK